MIKPYSSEIEAQMLALYVRLPEKNRRLYASIEALKLPYGGITYIAKLFDCSRETIQRGLKELGEKDTLPLNRNRKEGGGRHAALHRLPNINEVFLTIIKENTAGDPMDETKKWTNLSCAEIGILLTEKGFKVSRNIVKKLLKKNGYIKRKALKKSRRRTCESKCSV